MTPQEEQADWIKGLKNRIDKFPNLPCSLDQPIMICVPREGLIIACQRHSQGHFIRPSCDITY